MSPPALTVFIAVHNRAGYVGRAIESVLAQGFRDLELLLVDDGSTDDSVAVIEGYTDRRVRLVRNDRNLGIPLTRSRGLELARGRYFAVLDSDDVAPPGRLTREAAFLDAHPEVATVGGWAREMDETGRLRRGLKPLPLHPAQLHARLLFRTCHHHSSVTGRTRIMREHGYRQEFRVAEDFDLFSRIAERHRLANLPRVMLHRRVHAGRITREQADRVQAMNMAIVERQLAVLGVTPSGEELRLHFELARLKKAGIAPDRLYLERSADWLSRLVRANKVAGVYEPKALSAVITQLWTIACARSIAQIGVAGALRAFLASPAR